MRSLLAARCFSHPRSAPPDCVHGQQSSCSRTATIPRPEAHDQHDETVRVCRFSPGPLRRVGERPDNHSHRRVSSKRLALRCGGLTELTLFSLGQTVVEFITIDQLQGLPITQTLYVTSAARVPSSCSITRQTNSYHDRRYDYDSRRGRWPARAGGATCAYPGQRRAHGLHLHDHRCRR